MTDPTHGRRDRKGATIKRCRRTLGVAAFGIATAIAVGHASSGPAQAAFLGTSSTLAAVSTETMKHIIRANADTPIPERYAGYTVIGEVERVTIFPERFDIRAKVDTGAKTSSIDAEVLETETRGETNWVRVRVFGDEDRTHELELPVVRYVRIRRAGVPVERRPVVRMRICLGTIMTDAEVNLAERRRLSYRMLLGSDLLAGRFLVDPGEDFLTQPFCDDEGAK
ncbi:MAG: RimK/LysX family protein [Pseudomonadota bacterium]